MCWMNIQQNRNEKCLRSVSERNYKYMKTGGIVWKQNY